ncbi:helix-turn-helix domain-containing protein [Bacillus badius]|uniref:Transcriptional regulator, MerR family n=1 Tax=Bacillus badius TaxID=1455 RepID=A0ABR5APT4_BACBA|nr:XRE family transcriptional regulator [Bacillus badius]KIL74814.1 Transcriptional regulator, MerR family [Bacillus badius]KIL75825.1 Transcriptional regulator, MerR family [Bacillus badius]MED4718500.1 XRE family transcriptional regulator [Bacillus badius]
MEDIHKKIKALRLEKKLTLKELSEETGLSLSFLSQIERGASSLSITSLKKLAEALGVSMIFFFEDDKESQTYVSKAGDRKVFKVNGGDQKYIRLAGTFSDRKLEPLMVMLPPNLKEEHSYSHSGEEFYYILQGEVIFHINKDHYHLKAGDTVHFPSELLHAWENPTSEETIILSVSTPIIF